jgi:hypothetical protein
MSSNGSVSPNSCGSAPRHSLGQLDPSLQVPARASDGFAVSSMASEASRPKSRTLGIAPRHLDQVARRAAADLDHPAPASGPAPSISLSRPKR